MSEEQSSNTKPFLPIAVYYLTVVFFLVGSQYPESRLWAVNFWSLFPLGWNQLFVILALALPLPVFIASFFKFRLRSGSGDDAKNVLNFTIFSGILLILSSFIFYVFRVQTFFLGDGYGMLSLLSSASPAYVQVHEIGESLAHLWIYNLMGTGGESSALVTYQIISIIAGGLFVATVLFGAYRLFARNSDRMIFSVGILSCGYILMAFGYVENYSLFLLSVLLFTLVSLLATLGKINRWLVLPTLAISVFFHILGITLIPAAMYVLLQRCVRRSWRRGRSKSLTLGLLTLLMGGLVLFMHFYTTSYGFRFAFVPLITDRFTVEGYTLFSLRHFIDVTNLLFILVPALPIIVGLLFIVPIRQFVKRTEVRLLLLLSVSVIGAAFIFNPRLGMPRDWDLFAFIGLPIAVLLFYTLVSHRQVIKNYSLWVSAAVAIGLVSLIPRVAALNQPDVALARFQKHIDLDKKKNRYVSQLLKDYYTKRGETGEVEALQRQWDSYYPEMQLVRRAGELVKQRKYRESIRLGEEALELNPIYVGAYATLASCYISLGNYDSAMTLLKIAEGFSPDRSPTFSQMAMIHFLQGRYDRAEKLWLDAYALDTAYFEPLQGLARIYLQQGRSDKCLYFLSRAVRREDTPLSALVALGNLHLRRRDFENASKVFQRAIDKGLDSSFVARLKEMYPQMSFRLTDVSEPAVKQIDN